ncbi:uncharacterized protein TM35_000511090 [Trypanosoma theileri]|uniref:Mucin TcMUCII n=1 Tax=Trypanosoma theileri TaxID=67003 RepID=A0A1X0NHL3_9TRYP|nr:uncharacterized protein TM35_000511090 [Trypanosoma theileri]ORC84008.1 hypothetical protein TM35_000511090 [Trypanosoma theileri]
MLVRPIFCLLVFLVIVASVCVSANSSPPSRGASSVAGDTEPVVRDPLSGTLRIVEVNHGDSNTLTPPQAQKIEGEPEQAAVLSQEQDLRQTSQEHQRQEEITEGTMKTDKAKPDAPEKLTPTGDAQPRLTQVTDPKSEVPQGEINRALPQEQEPNESQNTQERDIPSDSNGVSNTNTVSKETEDSKASSTTPSPQTSEDTTASDGTPVNSSQDDIKNIEANSTESRDTTTNTSENINTDTPNTTSNNEESTSTTTTTTTTLPPELTNNKKGDADSSSSISSSVWMRTAAPLLIVAVLFSATMY